MVSNPGPLGEGGVDSRLRFKFIYLQKGWLHCVVYGSESSSRLWTIKKTVHEFMSFKISFSAVYTFSQSFSVETHHIGHSRFFCIFLRVSRTSSTFAGRPMMAVEVQRSSCTVFPPKFQLIWTVKLRFLQQRLFTNTRCHSMRWVIEFAGVAKRSDRQIAIYFVWNGLVRGERWKKAFHALRSNKNNAAAKAGCLLSKLISLIWSFTSAWERARQDRCTAHCGHLSRRLWPSKSYWFWRKRSVRIFLYLVHTTLQ